MLDNFTPATDCKLENEMIGQLHRNLGMTESTFATRIILVLRAVGSIFEISGVPKNAPIFDA